MTYSNNKLYRIKKRIEDWESSYNDNRQYEMKLSSLHIGHTQMAHEYLLTKEQLPMCQTTQIPIDSRTQPDRL